MWGRFLNADGILGANKDVSKYNLFAYCGNNPVIGIDPTGLWCFADGITLSGGAIFGGSINISFVIDSHLNVGLLVIPIGTACSPGASITQTYTLSCRDSIYDLSGISTDVGGGYYSQFYGLGGSGDVYFDNKGPAAASLSVGFGVPGVDAHGGVGATAVVPFNSRKSSTTTNTKATIYGIPISTYYSLPGWVQSNIAASANH